MTVLDLVALVAAAPAAPVETRTHLAEVIARAAPPGLVLSTCHRTEIHGLAHDVGQSLGTTVPAGVIRLEGHDAVRHLVAVAVGLESAVLAEDQVLHQLRAAAVAARQRGPLPPLLDRLTDLSLAAGRRARSWRPAGRRSLADVALDVAGQRLGHAVRSVQVVGAGAMGSLVAEAAIRRRAAVSIASPTPAHAAALAGRVGARVTPLDPGRAVAAVDLVAVALSGPWRLSPDTLGLLDGGRAVVVDLSAPRAVPDLPALATAGRLVLVDDLAAPELQQDDRHRRRLERLVDDTVDAFARWVEGRDAHGTAAALATQADEKRRRALEHLWRQLPGLAPEAREAIEAMSSHLAQDLLRDPVARIASDRRHEAAARDLFGL
jgi:glutamyl-tRNA reductase